MYKKNEDDSGQRRGTQKKAKSLISRRVIKIGIRAIPVKYKFLFIEIIHPEITVSHKIAKDADAKITIGDPRKVRRFHSSPSSEQLE